MTDWFSTLHATLDPRLLEPVVRLATGRADAVVTSFQARAVDYPNIDPDRRSLVRVTGDVVDATGTTPWSVVLKAFRRPTDASASVDDPSHFLSWEREPRFFESGLWSEIGPGIRSVRCHGVQRWGTGEAWVWLEDLADPAGARWSDREFERAAEDLGRFAGSFLAGRSLPAQPWLADARSVQEQYSIANPQAGEAILPVLESPPTTSAAAAKAFGPARDRRILHEAFRRQPELLDAVDRLPRALCHHDTLATNLFVQPRGADPADTVAIDWALVGVGPAGGDLGQLVAGSACFFRVSADGLDELDQLTFEAYRSGLAEEGGAMAARDVRLASLVTVLAQWTAVVAMHLIWALDPREEEWVTGLWRRPRQDVAEHFTALLAFLTRRAEEVLQVAADR